MNQAPSLAARLEPHQRQKLALKVLTRQEPISTVAEKEGVSRKFLYQQGEIAQKALNTAFEKPEKDDEVIYSIILSVSERLRIESVKPFKKPEKSIKLKI